MDHVRNNGIIKGFEYKRSEQLASIETALEHGVNGVYVMLFMGSKVELDTIRITEKVAADALVTELEVMCDSLSCQGPSIPDRYDSQAKASARRVGFEHGADVLNTYCTGSPESLRERYEPAKDAIEGGAAGLSLGRNTWQSDNPAGKVQALRIDAER